MAGFPSLWLDLIGCGAFKRATSGRRISYRVFRAARPDPLADFPQYNTRIVNPILTPTFWIHVIVDTSTLSNLQPHFPSSIPFLCWNHPTLALLLLRNRPYTASAPGSAYRIRSSARGHAALCVYQIWPPHHLRRPTSL